MRRSNREGLAYRLLVPLTGEDVEELRKAMERVTKRMSPRRQNEFLDSVSEAGTSESTTHDDAHDDESI